MNIVLQTSEKNFNVKHPPLLAKLSSRGLSLSTHVFTKGFATLAVEIPFIGIVSVILENQTLLKRTCSFICKLRMGWSRISINTDVIGSFAEYICRLLAFCLQFCRFLVGYAYKFEPFRSSRLQILANISTFEFFNRNSYLLHGRPTWSSG